jgi:hypothetical protein
MYLRITRGRFDPARSEEALRLTQDDDAVLRRLPGAQGYQAGLDRTAGTFVSVSTWDTEAHARPGPHWLPHVHRDLAPSLAEKGRWSASTATHMCTGCIGRACGQDIVGGQCVKGGL